jgi:hypothetical protein
MLIRVASTLALLLALASPAVAAPVQLLGMPSTASWSLLLPAGAPAAPDRQEARLDRETIFAILCGGLPAVDPGLKAHLWKVAGSLAAKPWTPPTVKVRVVVGPPAR